MKSHQTGKYVHIRKLCNKNNHLEMLAIDQRPPIFNIIKSKKKRVFLINVKKILIIFQKTTLAYNIVILFLCYFYMFSICNGL